jgi:hypothetical protein
MPVTDGISKASPGSSDADLRGGDIMPIPTPAEGGLLRQFHAALRQQDITYADLRRVQPTHGGYLWIHRQFIHIYNPPLPEIPDIEPTDM